MKTLRIACLVIVLALIFPLTFPAGAQPAKTFDALSYELENGMQVVVVPNHRVPVVTHMVWYRTGAIDEVPGKSGIAHFLEHLMFKGSGDLEPGEFSRIVKALGGRDNAFTSYDYTAYFQSVSKQHLERVMEMEAGRMRDLHPPLEEVASERDVVLEERSQRTDNNPAARFSEHMSAALYINHPYGRPIIGWRAEMEELNWDDAKAFHRKYYAPNNAILVVSGDVSGEDVLELARQYYGPLEPSDIQARKTPAVPPLDGSSHIVMRDPAVQQDSYQAQYLAPSARQNKEDALALQVLEEIMSGGSSSRLYKSLVVEQKIASSAGMYYQGDHWDRGSVGLYGTPVPGHAVEDVEGAIDDVLRELIDAGVTEAEVSDAIARMQAEAIYARDSVAGPAMVIGRALTTGSTLDDVESWPQDIGTVTAVQVQDVAARYLDPDKADLRSVRGYLLRAKTPDENEQEEDEE